MKYRLEEKQERYLYRTLCVIAAVAAMFPISSSHIMDSGMVTEWIAGVEEGSLRLWFLLPGALYRLTGDMVFVWRVYMAAVQLGTLLAAMLFFRRVFREAETRLPACAGVMLYLCGPYRIYVCYDLADLLQAAAWMLLPLYAWALLESFEKRSWKPLLAAAAALAGIGYADGIFFLILAVLTFVFGLVKRKPRCLAALAGGVLLFLPGLYRLGQYLGADAFSEPAVQEGWHLGEYLLSWSWRSGHPGMGLGMLIGLAALLWCRFVDGRRGRACRNFILPAFFLAALSFWLFPWERLSGLGGWAARLVSLMGTPGIFWGMAYFCLCVPAAQGAEEISGSENGAAAVAVPVMLLLFCVGICVYQCNMLTYGSLPLAFD